MAKNVMRDIVKSSAKKEAQIEKAEEPRKNFWNNFDLEKKSSKTSKIVAIPSYTDSGSKLALWIIAVVSIVILIFALSTLFTGATVTVTPKAVQFVLTDTQFEMKKGESFDIMTLTDTASTVIQSTKTELAEKKAAGKVVIYNNFSRDAQKLVATTRLETPDGKIYRIDEAVTVPGISTVAGESLPGSVEAQIHADSSGEKYNIENVDFTIPGFKNGPRYDKFYARSKGAISGGLLGEISIIDETIAKEAENKLLKTLEEKLLSKALASVPQNFVLYPDAIFYKVLSRGVDVGSGAQEVPVKAEVELSAIIIDATKLAGKIVASTKEVGESEQVYIPNLNEFSFNLKDKDKIDLSVIEIIQFSISGTGQAIWKIDNDKLLSDLSGKNKKNTSQIMSNYPEIEKVSASVKPFWKQSFPVRKDEIKIINTFK